MMTLRPTIVPLAAIALCLPTIAAAEPDAAISGTRLAIVAEGGVTRVPDVATVTAGVVTQASGASAAMAENARRMAAAIAALKRAGVADRDIRTAALTLSPQYRYADNQPPALTGYQASNQLAVTLRDIKGAGPILDTLVAQGINQIDGPSLSVDAPEAAFDEARAQAIATARGRAQLYAKASGLAVRRIVSIEEQGGDAPQPPRPMMVMMARAKEGADTAVASGEQKLTVSVRVIFELD